MTVHVADDRLHATSGDFVIVPRGAPHKFTNDGPGQSVMVCIHASPEVRHRMARMNGRQSRRLGLQLVV